MNGDLPVSYNPVCLAKAGSKMECFLLFFFEITGLVTQDGGGWI
jgi:hypothetical protein